MTDFNFTKSETSHINLITNILMDYIEIHGVLALDYSTAHDLVCDSSIPRNSNLYILKAWTDLIK